MILKRERTARKSTARNLSISDAVALAALDERQTTRTELP